MHMRTYGPQHISITLKGILVLNYKKKREFKNASWEKGNHLNLLAPMWQLYINIQESM